MVMSDKLDDFEGMMRNVRNSIFERIISIFMKCAVWSVVKMKQRTDIDALLKIKTMSDRIEAELASELMLRNRNKKHNQTKTFEKVDQVVDHIPEHDENNLNQT